MRLSCAHSPLLRDFDMVVKEPEGIQDAPRVGEHAQTEARSRLSENWFKMPSADPQALVVDSEKIGSTSADIKTALNSAFMESSRRQTDLAESDFKDAIKLADSVSSDWLIDQAARLNTNTMRAMNNAMDATRAFTSSIDTLPTPTRQRLNSMLLELGNAYAAEGTDAYKTHKDLVDKIDSSLPPELRQQFRDLQENDKQVRELIGTGKDIASISSAPFKTRTLLARFYAQQGDDDKAREVLNEMFKMNPGLKESPAFMSAMEDPSILNNTEWKGEFEVAKMPDPQQEFEKRFAEMLNKLFQGAGPRGGGGSGGSTDARPQSEPESTAHGWRFKDGRQI